MPIPARTLRARIDDRFGDPVLTSRELERDGRILQQARYILAEESRRELTMGNLALALRMSPATIRMAFCDLDNLVFEIIRRHLLAIEAALDAGPADAADRQMAQIEAYLKLARAGLGEHSEAHRILVRDRHGLPDDLAVQVASLRFRIGERLGGRYAQAALSLLDTPDLDAAQIAAMLAVLIPEQTAPKMPARPVQHRPAQDQAARDRPRAGAPEKAAHPGVINTQALSTPALPTPALPTPALLTHGPPQAGRAALLGSSAGTFRNALVAGPAG